MSGLFALFERAETLSLSMREFTDCALPSLPHGDSSANDRYLSDNKQIAERNNVCIVFVGKLLNRGRLVERICNRNPEANSQFDADIALELFFQEETQAFALMEGYWSLIIADKNTQKVYAARDHFGNRSLYYCKTDKQFGIASESKTLVSRLKGVGEINKNAVLEYLQCEDIYKYNNNLFSDIHELKPASYLVYSHIDNEIEEQPYYVLPYKNCKGGYNKYEEPFHIDKVRQLILENIAKNIAGKDKIAIVFDGGIDSATLLCCVKKLNPNCRLTAFTSTDLYGEREIDRVKKAINNKEIDWINVPCNPQEVLQQLREINRNQNPPVLSLNAVIQHNIMETAKQHGFDAIMDGRGADELFAGHTYYFLPFLKSLRSQWMFKDWAREFLLSYNSGISHKKLLSLKLKSFSKKHYRNDGKSVLNDYLYESYTNILPYISRFGEDIAASLGIDYLKPFSNGKELAEFVFSIPSTFKIHNGWTKYLLRTSMIGIVPDEIRWGRQKNEVGNEIKEQIRQINDGETL